MKECPECGSERVNNYPNYSECLDCMHREYKGDKVKRKPGTSFGWKVKQ